MNQKIKETQIRDLLFLLTFLRLSLEVWKSSILYSSVITARANSEYFLLYGFTIYKYFFSKNRYMHILLI
jgi:hypothetical protein